MAKNEEETAPAQSVNHTDEKNVEVVLAWPREGKDAGAKVKLPETEAAALVATGRATFAGKEK